MLFKVMLISSLKPSTASLNLSNVEKLLASILYVIVILSFPVFSLLGFPSNFPLSPVMEKGSSSTSSSNSIPSGKVTAILNSAEALLNLTLAASGVVPLNLPKTLLNVSFKSAILNLPISSLSAALVVEKTLLL